MVNTVQTVWRARTSQYPEVQAARTVGQAPIRPMLALPALATPGGVATRILVYNVWLVSTNRGSQIQAVQAVQPTLFHLLVARQSLLASATPGGRVPTVAHVHIA